MMSATKPVQHLYINIGDYIIRTCCRVFELENIILKDQDVDIIFKEKLILITSFY